MPDEHGERLGSCRRLLRVARVMIDNGSSYRSKDFPGNTSRPAPDLHPAVHAQDQRQGPTLHSNELARMAYARVYNSSSVRHRQFRYAEMGRMVSTPPLWEATGNNPPAEAEEHLTRHVWRVGHGVRNRNSLSETRCR